MPAVPFLSAAPAATEAGAPASGHVSARGVAARANCPDAAAADHALAFGIVSDRDAFAALEPEWNALFARSGRAEQAFQAYNWLWHWANHYLPGGSELAIVTVRRAGRLVLVWPLVNERKVGVDCLSWMGAPVGQYGDVIAEDGPDTGEIIRASWRFIVTTLAPDLVHLRKVRTDAVIAPFMAGIGARTSEHQQAPYLDLASAPDFPAYETRYPAKARKNRRRQMRRLEEQGAVGFEVHVDGSRAAALARLAVDMKREWLGQRGLMSPALADERMPRFLADVAAAASHPAGAQVSVLTVAGEAAGIAIAFACKRRLLVHVIVYDLRFEKAGAGNLLVEHCLKSAKARGIERVDLLAPGDAYKLDWADAAVEVADRAVALTLKGRLLATLYLGFVRGKLKSLVPRLPVSLRRFLAASHGLLLALI